MKTYKDESLLHIDHFKEIKKVISIPDGFQEIRETGNIFEDDKKYWIATLVRNERDSNGDKIFNIGYWTLDDFKFQGILNLPEEAEDGHIKRCTDGLLHIAYENKSLEKQSWIDTNHDNFKTKWAVSHAVCETIDGKFRKLPDERGIMPYGKYMAIYSPILNDDGVIQFYDSRHIPNTCFEDIHYSYLKNDKQVLTEPMITAKSLGLDGTGLGGDYFKINDKYVMDCVGLKDAWFEFMMVSDRLDGGWKRIGKRLKNQDGKLVFPRIFYSDGWKALISTNPKCTEWNIRGNTSLPS